MSSIRAWAVFKSSKHSSLLPLPGGVVRKLVSSPSTSQAPVFGPRRRTKRLQRQPIRPEIKSDAEGLTRPGQIGVPPPVHTSHFPSVSRCAQPLTNPYSQYDSGFPCPCPADSYYFNDFPPPYSYTNCVLTTLAYICHLPASQVSQLIQMDFKTLAENYRLIKPALETLGRRNVEIHPIESFYELPSLVNRLNAIYPICRYFILIMKDSHVWYSHAVVLNACEIDGNLVMKLIDAQLNVTSDQRINYTYPEYNQPVALISWEAPENPVFQRRPCIRI
ncbi:hypothetical protein Fcan01_18969 [Folsomia candida]|uniref:Uncharacterized protein n=1 Tax=Folsomia candida TaxID=158441 RepID=A0A226DKW9_FOLCA|nr:hypothetical protein Fcan01_18969 [Folsomia candida]